MLTDLKPCPFCGGRIGLKETGHSDDCYIMRIRLGYERSPGEWNEAWNTRTSKPGNALTDERIQEIYAAFRSSAPVSLARAIESEVRAEAQEPVAPTEAIGKILSEVMEIAVANGANSISMPDEYVEIAAWLSGIAPQPPAPCPNCLGQEPDDLRLRNEYIKAEREIKRLQAEVAELEGKAKVLAAGYIQEHEMAVALRVELEKALTTSFHQAALIEKCEKALNQHHSLEAKREAFAAIEAYRTL